MHILKKFFGLSFVFTLFVARKKLTKSQTDKQSVKQADTGQKADRQKARQTGKQKKIRKTYKQADSNHGGIKLVFLNPYGAQESMPRHQFRQPM